MIDRTLVLAVLVVGTLVLFALDWRTEGAMRTRGVMLAILAVGLVFGIVYTLGVMYGYII